MSHIEVSQLTKPVMINWRQIGHAWNIEYTKL